MKRTTQGITLRWLLLPPQSTKLDFHAAFCAKKRLQARFSEKSSNYKLIGKSELKTALFYTHLNRICPRGLFPNARKPTCMKRIRDDSTPGFSVYRMSWSMESARMDSRQMAYSRLLPDSVPS